MFLSSLYLLLLSLHGMVAYIIPTIIIPSVIVFLIYKFYFFYYNQNLIVYQYRNNRTKVVYGSIFIFYIVLLFSIIFYTDFYVKLGFPVQELWIKYDYDYPYQIGRMMNIGRTYTELGILQFFSILGVLALFQRDFKSISHNIIIAVLGVQLIFILDVEYFLPVFLTMLSILVGYGIQLILPHIRTKRKLYVVTLVVLLLAPVSYALFLKDLNTRVQVHRDFGAKFQDNHFSSVPGEAWNAGYWRNKYIPSEKMILNNPPGHLHISLSGDIQTLEDELLIWNWKDGALQEIIEVDEYPFYKVFFHQRDGILVGGSVQDWYGPSDDIYPDMHESYILYKLFNYELLINQYEINYVAHWHHPNEDIEGANNTKFPIFQDVYNENYKIYSNELYNFFFYSENY